MSTQPAGSRVLIQVSKRVHLGLEMVREADFDPTATQTKYVGVLRLHHQVPHGSLERLCNQVPTGGQRYGIPHSRAPTSAGFGGGDESAVV